MTTSPPMLWKRLSGLLLVAIMILAPYVGEYVKNRIDAAYSAVANATASEPSGLTPAFAGFASALHPTPARADGEDACSNDAARNHTRVAKPRTVSPKTQKSETTQVHGIKVDGPTWFKKQVEQALDLLKRKDPENYRLVVENVTEISADRSVTGLGVFARVNPTTDAVRYKPWRDELPASMAATLVHEAAHVYAYKNGLPYSGEEGEDFASEKWNEASYRLTRR